MLAPAPIATVLLLLVVLARWAKLPMPVAFVVPGAIPLIMWRTDPARVMGASLSEVSIANSRPYIVFNAILMFNTLEASGGIRTIRTGFPRISPDRRVQASIVAWLSGSLIEGASGFGAPAATRPRCGRKSAVRCWSR